MTKILFIDRDGTLILEPPDEQVDSLEKLEFYPGVFQYLGRIATELDYLLVMVTNQDGLGTDSFPKEDFLPVQNKILSALRKEGVVFYEILIDKSFPEENLLTRKPGTGLLTQYMQEYDLKNSFVIGDRITDVELAVNLGSKAILLASEEKVSCKKEQLALQTTSWKSVYEFLRSVDRITRLERNTLETEILVELNLDGNGETGIDTGIGFFDHLLEQIGKHGLMDLKVEVKGDLDVDEHHTIEDTALVLGEAFRKAVGDKRGIERYGYCLPMDDSLAMVAVDFGGRPWIEWEASFKREKIGEMPTEMFYHFFKSFTDAARCNLYIKAQGTNEHHKIEAIFKAFARSVKSAVKRDPDHLILPTTKGAF